jgi:hypothetical protein
MVLSRWRWWKSSSHGYVYATVLVGLSDKYYQYFVLGVSITGEWVEKYDKLGV